MEKYNIGNLVNVVRNRTDRCSLERIFGLIFSLEFRVLPKIKSALGDIFMHTPGWGYNYDEYIQQIEKDGRINTTTGVVKVWTGR